MIEEKDRPAREGGSRLVLNREPVLWDRESLCERLQHHLRVDCLPVEEHHLCVDCLPMEEHASLTDPSLHCWLCQRAWLASSSDSGPPCPQGSLSSKMRQKLTY